MFVVYDMMFVKWIYEVAENGNSQVKWTKGRRPEQIVFIFI